MKKRALEEARKHFRGAKSAAHDSHIGRGPKPSPKSPVNVSIDREILALAKEMNVNLSQALEAALRKLTEEERTKRLREKYREAIESHNAFYEKYGTLSEAILDLDDPSV
jgi:antitoxin CcdA